VGRNATDYTGGSCLNRNDGGRHPAASTAVAATPSAPEGAQPRLASDPAQLADDLVADEFALPDPPTGEAALVAAARRQQAAYRVIARHPEWAAPTRARILDARRQLTAMAHEEHAACTAHRASTSGELLSYYHETESQSGVDWNYLAAINLIVSRFGSIVGVSTAGAEGPMQFLPSTFADYGEGGDIH
jgi:membrane-bound lytic murein transglycosylase B